MSTAVVVLLLLSGAAVIGTGIGGGRMAVAVVASFNVEDLSARPKAFSTIDWAAGGPVLAAYRKFTTLIAEPAYIPADRARMPELLAQLEAYHVNAQGTVRRRVTADPPCGWQSRGSFDREPRDPTADVQITAIG
jgi:hypothetical protein